MINPFLTTLQQNSEDFSKIRFLKIHIYFDFFFLFVPLFRYNFRCFLTASIKRIAFTTYRLTQTTQILLNLYKM